VVSGETDKGRLFKAVMLACVATVLGASYALDATLALRDRRSGYESPGDVIAAFQKPAFLAYVKRRQMQSDPQLKRVSVGDALPDSGVRYYGIPLRYGSPFYRCAVIGDEVVIADPGTGRVIQVID
jgi:hypothetical protein